MITQHLFRNTELFLRDTDPQGNNINNGGLYNGNTGIAIVYYLLARELGDKLLGEKGMHLLEWVSENGVSGENIGFADGLAGIGWAIEWLAQNEFIEDINTDEILASVDTVLYKAVSYDKDDNLTLANGTLGKIAFFAKRAVKHNACANRLKTVGHLECLVLLLDDLAEKAGQTIAAPGEQEAGDDEENTGIGPIDLGHILCSITALKVKVNSPTSGNILYGSVNATERILTNAAIYSGNYLDYLYLACCYLIAAKNMDHPYWESKAIQHIERIVAIAHGGILTTEKLFQKLIIFCLLNVLMPGYTYLATIEQLITTLSAIELPPSLLNGRGTLVLAELCLTNPKLIRNWHDVFFL